jgi:hypothetical protein
MTERGWQAFFLGAGTGLLGIAGWPAISPRTFTNAIADFGPYNEHLIHDVAAVTFTFGVGLVIAAVVRAWRTPVLALAAIWNGAHAIAHIADAGKAHPKVLGPVEAVVFVSAAIGLALLARMNSMTARDTPRRRSARS